MWLSDHQLQVCSLKQASDFTIHTKCQMRSGQWNFPHHVERTNPGETKANMPGEVEESKTREMEKGLLIPGSGMPKAFTSLDLAVMCGGRLSWVYMVSP